MTNFIKMEQNFVALTEEELMDVDGGAWPIVAWVIANPVTAAKNCWWNYCSRVQVIIM